MTAESEAAKPTVFTGVQLTGFVVVGVASWIAIGAFLLHLQSFFASFLLLWFWATVEKADHRRLASAIIGALTGLLLAWFYRYAAASWGAAGMAVGLGLIVVAIFVQVMNWVALAVNSACMLFLTVACIPVLLPVANFPEVGAAVLTGGLYFAVLVWLAQKYVATRSARSAIGREQ